MNQEAKNIVEQIVYLVVVLVLLALMRELYIFLTDLV